MAQEIFVDASAWVAVTSQKDNHHQAAAQIYPIVIAGYARLITTNLVVAEAHALIRHEAGHKHAIQFLEGLSGPRLEKIFPDASLEVPAIDILRRFHDHDFSYADAVSFALMRERKITDVFTFDRHFDIMGFRRVP